MMLVEVFSDPGGSYLGAVAVTDLGHLPFRKHCGHYWWRAPGWKVLGMKRVDELRVEVHRAPVYRMDVRTPARLDAYDADYLHRMDVTRDG